MFWMDRSMCSGPSPSYWPLANGANRVTTNSTGNPFNTWHSPFHTGSQYVLAYEAGAKLINLDLKQQATLLPKSFGSAGMNGINVWGPMN